MAQKYYYGCGKRKTAVAKVRLHIGGKGNITINEKPMDKYLTVKSQFNKVYSPLKITKTKDKFDISVKVYGGGITAQAEAIRHGISKGLLEFDPELRTTLKKAGFITRDPRVKERKKPGLKRARRAPQFSKR